MSSVNRGLDSDVESWQEQLEEISRNRLERALSEPVGVYRFHKLQAFVSPAAEEYLEKMAKLAHQLTVQRFGKTIRLYVPLYLSNYCINSCRYCGFNRESKSERRKLTIEQALCEADVIASEGFKDVLLVSSEDRRFITTAYLAKLARKLRDKFSSISIEVYQMSTAEYAELFAAGIDGVTLYQETYNRKAYAYYHPSGPKSDYDNRLSGPDNIAVAGMREIGVGALLGLADWRVETLGLAEHVHYLAKRYWQSHVSVSFPRLRPAANVDGSQFRHSLSDKNFVQMILALRLCFANVGLVLSTRERSELRDRLIKPGITKMSAGSKTNPGGYSKRSGTVEQFEVDDKRSPAQVAAMLKTCGYEPIWKDWDSSFAETKGTF
jgi:2-iminoacetate synthase